VASTRFAAALLEFHGAHRHDHGHVAREQNRRHRRGLDDAGIEVKGHRQAAVATRT